MPAATEDPAIELESIRWERVQLILEARVIPGAAVDPATLGLTRSDGGDGGAGETMAPTGATIDGQRVTQTIRPSTVGVGLTSEFEFDSDPGKVFFYVSPHRLSLSSSSGTWQSGRLEIPAGQGKKFSVTIIRQETKPKTPAVAP